MSNQIFRFRYSVFTVHAELDTERLVSKTGMRTVVAPIARLEHLYVRADRGSDNAELLLTWRNNKGRLKRVRIFSDQGEAGFDALVEALLTRRPGIDVRHLDPGAAYRLSGSKELEWVALPAVMALGWAVVALLFTPMFVHGFDRGAATVAVEDLARGVPTETRNLTVVGRLATEAGIRGKAGGDRKLEKLSAWIPVVGPAWKPGEPVHVVLEIRGEARSIGELVQQDRFTGVLRDVWWEGLSHQRTQAFGNKGVMLAPGVRVLQLGADPRADLVLASVVLGFLALIVVGVTWGLWRRRRDA